MSIYIYAIWDCSNCWCIWQQYWRVIPASFVVLFIDREVTWDALLESDSCLLPGTFRHAALPEVPGGAADVHCTSVYQWKWSGWNMHHASSVDRELKWWTYIQVEVCEALLDVVMLSLIEMIFMFQSRTLQDFSVWYNRLRVFIAMIQFKVLRTWWFVQVMQSGFLNNVHNWSWGISAVHSKDHNFK